MVLVSFLLFAGACSGGGGGDGVATLAAGTGDAASGASNSDTEAPSEEEILAWVECMRNEGLDIADPTVDDDGNLVLGGGPRGPRTTSDTTTDGSTDAQPPDQEGFQVAIEKCGQPPRTGGAFSEEDRQQFQDSALAMAQCLREQGLDVADPDFSGQGPGGGPPPAADNDAASGDAPTQRGPFGGIDLEDPEVQTAFDTCREQLGDSFPTPGGGGGPGFGQAAGGGADD